MRKTRCSDVDNNILSPMYVYSGVSSSMNSGSHSPSRGGADDSIPSPFASGDRAGCRFSVDLDAHRLQATKDVTQSTGDRLGRANE